MDYKFTYAYQHSKVCGDNRKKNFLLFFLNDVLILKQKMPFNRWITDIHLLNGYIHQKRQAKSGGAWWRSSNPKETDGKLREVKYPISKKILEQFNIPKDTKITLQNG
jgi:hypothetical protein